MASASSMRKSEFDKALTTRDSSRSRGSVFCIMTRLRARRARVWVPDSARNFSLLHNAQTNSGHRLASCSKVTGGSFPGGKATGAWGSPLAFI
jgi:hypothetical protein